jgi:protein-tyrosine-phosphatase
VPEGLPGAVLFACARNRTRSPMAAALLRASHGGRIHVDSCGIEADEGVDPMVVEVLAEIGVDLAGGAPKTFEQLDDDSFDLVVSLTPGAQHRAARRLRGRSVEIEYWPTYDPTGTEGGRETVLDGYRQLRAQLQRRISERFGEPST